MPKDAIVYFENGNSGFFKLKGLVGVLFNGEGEGAGRVVNTASLRGCYTIIRLSSIENQCLRKVTILGLESS